MNYGPSDTPRKEEFEKSNRFGNSSDRSRRLPTLPSEWRSRPSLRQRPNDWQEKSVVPFFAPFSLNVASFYALAPLLLRRSCRHLAHSLLAQFAMKSKIIDRMRTELSEITTVWNTRLEYFVQLQKLSDDVADPNFSKSSWKGITAEIAIKVQEEGEPAVFEVGGTLLSLVAAKFENEISTSGVKLRYLTSLTGQEGTSCVICTDEDYAAGQSAPSSINSKFRYSLRICLTADSFRTGVLTSCGHSFCEPCIKIWRLKSELCPVCKRRLEKADWQRIVYRKKVEEEDPVSGDAEAVEETERTLQQPQFGTVSLPLERIKLSYIDPEELSVIAAVDTAHRLSAKSTLIVKHVKHLRRIDTTAKIVIFSTWTESLAVCSVLVPRPLHLADKFRSNADPHASIRSS